MDSNSKVLRSMKGIVLLCSTLWIGSAIAGEFPDIESDFGTTSISGFGSIGAVYHDTESAVFRRDFAQPKGAQAGEVYFGTDSSLGVQVNQKFTNELNAAVQVVSRLGPKGNFAPQVTWAYLKYTPTAGSSIRIGRLGIEAYLQGDAAEIDYANTPIRPSAVYIPRTYDGIDAEYSESVGDNGLVRGKLMFGRSVNKAFPLGQEYSLANIPFGGGFLEYSNGPWLMRGSLVYIDSKKEAAAVDIYNTIFTDLKTSTGGLVSVKNDKELLDLLSYKDRRWVNSLFSISYDSGPLQWQGNYLRSKPTNLEPRNIFYTNIAYRIDSFSPYLGYTLMKTKREFTSPDYQILYPIPGIDQALDPITKGLLVAQTGYMINQSTWTAGVRYDISSNVALKLQADLIRFKDPEAIIDKQLLDAATNGSSLNAINKGWRTMPVISAALNFVF